MQGQTKKIKPDKSQAECFFCKKRGHWNRNCPQYIAFLDPNRLRKKQAITGQDIYMITLFNFSICDITDWVLDIDSPYDICNLLQELQVSRRFEQDERFLNIEDGRLVSVLALEILKLVFESHPVVLNNCHFCLSFFFKCYFCRPSGQK